MIGSDDIGRRVLGGITAWALYVTSVAELAMVVVSAGSLSAADELSRLLSLDPRRQITCNP
jgi:hypothetical protein